MLGRKYRKYRNMSKPTFTLALGLGIAALFVFLLMPNDCWAFGIPSQIAPPEQNVVKIFARRSGVAVGPRGGFAARRTTVVGRPGWNGGGVRRTTVVRPGWNGGGVRRTVVRPGWNGGGVRWARPGWYRWPSGGAIAAGAALGFVTASTAVAWTGAAPAAGMCWYYTDVTKTQGFWDYCP